MGIGASVGKGGTNDLADVLVVQHLLNDWLASAGKPAIATSGAGDAPTLAAIVAFQAQVMKAPRPDGLIGPGGATWRALSAANWPKPPLSGADWWRANQANYPNSAAVADLVPAFRDKVTAFLKALKDAGASVTVSVTRRNAVRAQLMHYSWRVANGSLAPGAVPAIPGCTIRWDHGDPARSRQGAQEMVDLFQIAFQPSLTSLHIEGRAIDMTIAWKGTIQVRDAGGRPRAIGAPQSGETNTDLHALGATYGVIKLVSDPPHWSDNGH